MLHVFLPLCIFFLSIFPPSPLRRSYRPLSRTAGPGAAKAVERKVYQTWRPAAQAALRAQVQRDFWARAVHDDW